MSHGSPRPPTVFDRAFLTGIEGVTRLTFVRHGEQEVPAPGGPAHDTFDPPLSDRGHEQARLVGERLSTERVDIVFASPLRRALDTGIEVARHHRLEPEIIQDLREIELFRDVPGDRSIAEFVGTSLLRGITERMLHERKWDVYPFSESSFEFRKRVANAIESILAEHEGRSVVVACHAGVINAYVAHIIGVDRDMFFRPAHTSLSIVYAGHGMRALQSLNDVRHLETSEGSFLTH